MARKDRKLLGIEMDRVSAEGYKDLPASGVVVVLDNIRSAYNVGSIFRTCDAFVPWEYAPETLPVIERLRAEGYETVCVEQTVHSVKLDTFVPAEGKRYAVVLGNEVDGVQQEIVDVCDFSLEIPQFGSKHSLNVSVAAGVVLWHLRLRG